MDYDQNVAKYINTLLFFSKKNSQIFHIYGSFFHMKGNFESYLCIFYKCGIPSLHG